VTSTSTDGRAAASQSVTNPEGEQYRFDLTGQYGTGVGCLSVEGTPHLVGFSTDRPAGDPSAIDRIAVTTIELDSTHARSGQTTTASPAGREAAERATRVTCGERTLEDDGLGVVE